MINCNSEELIVSISLAIRLHVFLLNLVNISSNLLDNNCPEIANNVEINIIENKDNFTEQEWKSLYKLSEETFVEETESLKQGAAGAGLTDND